MDTLLTVVIIQPQSIVVGKHFTVMIIKLLNVISRILIIHLLPIYFCTSSCYARAAVCLEGHLSLLALSSVYSPQSLATNSPAPGPRPLTCGVSSECLGTRSYETTSRDQRGKIQMFFSSTGACTAAKFPIANRHSQINTQLYSASLIRLI